MDFQEYKAEALKTEWTGHLDQEFFYDAKFMKLTLDLFITASKLVDLVKKRVIYGKPIERQSIVDLVSQAMKTIRLFNDYEMGTESYTSSTKLTPEAARVCHSVLTTATETGELIEAITVPLYSDDWAQRSYIVDELGDCEWARCLLFDSLNLDPSEVWQQNIVKIKARYGDKFSVEKALNRNVEKEKYEMQRMEIE